LLLHGYLSSSESFYFQSQFFRRYFNVYAPDLKGFGKNADMEYPYSLDDYILDVKKYIKENALKNPHVIAHSFGGRIALKMASETPDAFDKIVLVGCAGLKPKRKLKYRIKKFVYKIIKPFLLGRKPKIFFSKDYLSLSPVMKESFCKIVGEHLDYALPRIKNQTLIVFGKSDKETPVYMAKRLNKGITNSRLYLIDGAGHFCFCEKPEKFNWEVREFLLSK
jgi:pimeloyl-ACP methyl ester carboxylesterase